jgi:hypothetical protein
MTDFRFLAVQYLRAKTLTDICELANRSYKGYTSDERECLLAIARVVTREIIEKCRKEREQNV